MLTVLIGRIKTKKIEILKEIKTLSICLKKPAESAFWSEQITRREPEFVSAADKK